MKIASGTSAVICGEPVVIRGEGLSGVSAVTIGDHHLGLVSTGHDALVCEAFDIFRSPFAFGESVPLTVTGSAGTHTVHVTLEPPEGVQYVVVDGVQPYLSQGLDVVDGDQMATETNIGNVALLLSPDTDVKYTPAAPDDTMHTRYWYNPRTLAWGEGTVTVDGGLASGPVEWTGTPAPPSAAVGVPYTYTIGTLIEGDRPIALSDVNEPPPPGLSYDDEAYPETISGTPTEPGEYYGIVVRANNGTIADSAPFTIVVNAAAPSWNGPPTPSPATVGSLYSYSIGLKLDGSRPVTLSDVGEPLPPGLAYNTTSSPEVILGTPTTYGVYSGIITRADNGTIADSAPYTITVNAAPELSGLAISGITDNGARFTVNALVGAGMVHYVADVSTQRPSPEQIAAGVTAEGVPAMAAGGYTVTQAGPQPAVAFVGFERFTTVSLWVVQTLSGMPSSNVLGQVFITTGTTDTLVLFF